MLKFDESQWTVTPSNDGGVPYYTLVGLRSGQRTRLFEIEYQLASALDGTKSCLQFCPTFEPVIRSSSVLMKRGCLLIVWFSVRSSRVQI